jgi:hypothetical protein
MVSVDFIPLQQIWLPTLTFFYAQLIREVKLILFISI